MEFSDNQIVIIVIVVVVIVVFALFSFIRKKKQENEMNTFSSYKSTSGPKSAPEIKPLEKTNYKFSLDTGEEIEGTESNDIYSLSSQGPSDALLSRMEEKLKTLNISEEQKERVIQQFKLGLAKNKTEPTHTFEEKIEIIQNSDMSDAQKEKVIDALKKRHQNPSKESIDNLFDALDDKQ
jgi:hypothetical protein